MDLHETVRIFIVIIYGFGTDHFHAHQRRSHLPAKQAERQGVPFEIAIAVIERESSYKPDAVSDTGDFGLMQINVCNHRWLYEELGITDVMDPEQNIEAGIYILGQAFQKYDDPDKALMAYNMGDSGMKAAWSKGQHSSKYSRAVLETAQSLKRKEQ